MTSRLRLVFVSLLGIPTIGLLIAGPVVAYLAGYTPAEMLGGLLEFLMALTYTVIGMIVAIRQSRNPLGWIFCIIGFLIGLGHFAYRYTDLAYNTYGGALWLAPAMTLLKDVPWMVVWWLIFSYVLLLFPDGRLPSPRWRWVAWGASIPLAVSTAIAVLFWPYRGERLLSGSEIDPFTLIPAGDLLIFSLQLLIGAFGVLSVSSLIIRYRTSSGVTRMQLKWFAFAAALTLGGAAIGLFLPNGLLHTFMILVAFLSIPIAIGVSVLRYRLYDIDTLIHRTLVYSFLTGCLALTYLGGVVLLEGTFRALTGQTSSLSVVISTLTIAALFNPLRRVIQHIIDRRFFRRKYNAQKALRGFSTALRSEVQLDNLSEELLKVIDETMQPTHVTLWLKPTAYSTGVPGGSGPAPSPTPREYNV